MANESITVTISLPKPVYEKWRADKNRKGVIAKLVAEYYGFVIQPRVVANSTLNLR